ncbi:hypothetical protein [Mesorhizobium sp. NZP2077]|uniref:hypothetical protein n=1 Tax=Mesorhizobium sp. NZP2077 TaxID=2483404 RepID=UPI001557FD0A|nr:hypothetical protein [Mesorhizobium sp. NZP2077]QKC84328.1 hypothetical protein EB232_24485 [Mesorhizobium sp. NZP2077]QKD17888.1 hypothetical protein HGP13_24185 [Mesorhizobium sp. NZP2077]
MTKGSFAEFVKGYVKSLTIVCILIAVLAIPLGAVGGEAGAWTFVIFLGPIVAASVFIVLPIVVATTYFGVRRRGSAQIFGAVAFYPLTIAIFFTARYGLMLISAAQMDEAYLKRTIEHPIGKIETMAYLGMDCYRTNCPQLLVDGFVGRVAFIGQRPKVTPPWGERAPPTDPGLWVKKAFRLGQGPECRTKNLQLSGYWIQQRGIFDVCIVPDSEDFLLGEATLTRDGRANARDVERFFGPKGDNIAVAYRVSGGEIGPEIARWESGQLPFGGGAVGARFEQTDFMRALSGVTTDRFAEAAKFDLASRIDIIHAAIGNVPIDITGVVSYLRTALPKGSVKPTLLDESRKAKLLDIGTSSCTPRDPTSLALINGAKNCVRTYNRFVLEMFGTEQTALQLPEPNLLGTEVPQE